MMHINSQEIADPQSIEEITSANFFLTVILAEVEELEDICVPWLKVNGERARALVATLVYVSRSRVVRAKHRHDTVRITVGASNV
jgi:hypothetical protein